MPEFDPSALHYRNRRNRWRAVELEGLAALAATIPARHLPEHYNRWAREHRPQLKSRLPCSILAVLEDLQITPPQHSTWSERELRRLQAFVDDFPPTLLTTIYNSWATKAGFSHRTLEEITEAARDHLSIDPISPTGAWSSAEAVARLLRFPLDRVIQLAEQKLVKGILEPDGRWFLSTGSFVYLARNHSPLLAGADPFGVLALTGRNDLANRVASIPAPPKPPRPRPVQRLEDLRWWPTPQQAAAACHIDADTIRKAADTGVPTPAGRFRYVTVPSRCLSR